MLLKAKNIGITFGGLKAVSGFNLGIKKGEILGLIGPNGAGKTTVFNLLTGIYTPTEGEISFEGKNITGKTTSQINHSGIARTFQNIRLFKDLSVIDNVKIAFNNSMKYGEVSAILRLPSFRKEEKEVTRKALEILKVFDLDSLVGEKAGNLPYGKQRKLEIARALGTSPKLLLLDEPAAGMNPSETIELMDTIKVARDKFDISILLIEHDMNLVMNVCEKLVVLDYGSVIATGKPEEIKDNKAVVAAYLGE